MLEDMRAGITIQSIVARTEVPRPVYNAYQEVSKAESQKAQIIRSARQQYVKLLGDTAGEAADALYDLVGRYEDALTAQDEQAIAQLGAQLDEALDTLRMPEDLGGQRIGGEVAKTINQARSDRTELVESLRAEATQFALLLEEYRRNPAIFTSRLRQDMRQNLFSSGDIETLYVPTGDLRIDTQNDPVVARDREERRAEEKKRQFEEEGRRELQQRR